jgi:glucuronokinase
MRALMSFFGIEIPKPMLANLVLSVEQDELKISAGLQDRVAQAFECPVYMDFDEYTMKKQGFGKYHILNGIILPKLYIAYRLDLSEGSEVVHNNFRERYNFKDKEVIKAISEWILLTDKVYELLLAGKHDGIGELLNRNFDIRKSVMNVGLKNLQMVETARAAGASAKFTGSGGAVIGTYEDEKMFERLKTSLSKTGVEVIKPEIVCKEQE